MFKNRILAIVATAFALTAVRAAGQVITTFALDGTSHKICQLNGENDWESGLPTAAQTLTNYGMIGADLAAPVDTGGSTLYFLFGDTMPWGHLLGEVVPPDDSVGTSTLKTTPASATCLGLQIATATSSTPVTPQPPTVSPAIDQGSFNVPSGGVYVNGTLYEFFWTNHCFVQPLPPPSPASDPLQPVTSTSTACPENASRSTIGISVLGQWTEASDVKFNQLTVDGTPVTMPSGFVYVNAVDATHLPNLAPSSQQLGVFITGVPRYRASVPYLAYSTAANLGDPSQWMFFSGLTGNTPNWISRTAWESKLNSAGRWMPPSGAEIYNPTTSEECVGEHSLSWNAPLNAWLLLYGCVGSIEARYAPAPWGPWSDPIVLLSPTHDPGIFCTLIMSPTGCGKLTDSWPNPVENAMGTFNAGLLYAPFVMSRFTQDASLPEVPTVRGATIYWLVSTFNPYVVVVMQSTLQLTTSTRPNCGPLPNGVNTCR
jgi:hypothetical protein